jgi:hypothetical protein
LTKWTQGGILPLNSARDTPPDTALVFGAGKRKMTRNSYEKANDNKKPSLGDALFNAVSIARKKLGLPELDSKKRYDLKPF